MGEGDGTDYLPAGATVESVETAPDIPAVFAVWAGERSAYLARTTVLGRRLRRVMKLWNLAEVVTRIEYWPVYSRLEAALCHYFAARRLFPGDYARRVKLPTPAYVKLILSNRFPRTQVTSRLAGGPSMYYGPFRTRAAAEAFETGCLELFQLRRCQEDLDPSPTHPGCVYGEMNLCLRPCQRITGEAEYASEVRRAGEFLTADGLTMLRSARAARDRFSEEMDFEEAARQHRRIEKIEAALALRDGLARELDRLNGVAITPGGGGTVKLWFVSKGWWQAPRETGFLDAGGSVDHQLREAAAAIETVARRVLDRPETLASLARRRVAPGMGGEWLGFEDFSRIPYRKFSNAVTRVRKGEA